MKNIYLKNRSWMMLLFFFLFACNEQEILEEIPEDFYSPENAFVNYNDYQAALTDLYARVRDIQYGGDRVENFSHFLGTDVAKHARGDANRFGDYQVWMNPTNGMVRFHWNNWFKVISNANTIIDRVQESALTDEEKQVVTAEAKFFRGLAYRYLVYIYGGVPILTQEITSPKKDLVRASKADVLQQVITDLKDAAENLPSIDQVADGKVSNLVAYHFLSETYIATGQYDEAIAAATVVIDNPNTALMTSRFGSLASQNPGDPYWDLFRVGNQNRSGGNTEALWVIQIEADVPGGLVESTTFSNNALERWAGPVAWLTYRDPSGKEGMLTLGQSNLNAGGRGVSFMMNTNYYLNDIWESDFDNDLRNSPYNIVRDIKYNNPASAYYDSSALKYPSPTQAAQKWRWYPYPSKITTPGQHPDQLFEDKSLLTLKGTAGSTFSDQYLLRLAETYLLRAEAYLMKDDLTNAAEDINVVRARANATAVNAGDVTLDYILDERARELVYEEQRRLTLSRTGTLVERVRKYNDLNADEIQDYHALWPIPFADIEANTGAVLEQNEGY